MDEGRGPLKELKKSERTSNAVRDPMDKGRGPLNKLEKRLR
jgi:hypothetical protein